MNTRLCFERSAEYIDIVQLEITLCFQDTVSLNHAEVFNLENLQTKHVNVGLGLHYLKIITALPETGRVVTC